MGSQPAKPRGWDSQMGRDNHAVGPGVVPMIGRMTRERIAPPRKYRRPPDIGLPIVEESGDISAGGTSQSLSIDVTEGVWSVSARHTVEIDTGTLEALVGVSSGSEATGPGMQSLTSGIIQESGPLTVIGPATANGNSYALLTGGTITNREIRVRAVRIA